MRGNTQTSGVLRLFRNMRSALGNEAAWRVSRQLQRCCLSGSGFPLTRLPSSREGQEVLWLPPPWGLGMSGAHFCNGVDFVHVMPLAELRGSRGRGFCPLGLRGGCSGLRSLVAGACWASGWVFILVLLQSRLWPWTWDFTTLGLQLLPRSARGLIV